MINQLKRNHLSRLVLGIFVSSFFAACNDYEIPESPAYVMTINRLAEKSPTGNIEGLKLPSAYDFNRIPQDPQNPLTKEKVELGKLLFHETA